MRLAAVKQLDRSEFCYVNCAISRNNIQNFAYVYHALDHICWGRSNFASTQHRWFYWILNFSYCRLRFQTLNVRKFCYIEIFIFKYGIVHKQELFEFWRITNTCAKSSCCKAPTWHPLDLTIPKEVGLYLWALGNGHLHWVYLRKAVSSNPTPQLLYVHSFQNFRNGKSFDLKVREGRKIPDRSSCMLP